MVFKVLVIITTTQNPYIWSSSKGFLSICYVTLPLPLRQGEQEYCRLVRLLWARTLSAKLCGHFFHDIFHVRSLGRLSWGVMTSWVLFPKLPIWIDKSRNWWRWRNVEHLERGLRPFLLDWETAAPNRSILLDDFLVLVLLLPSNWKISSQPWWRKCKDWLV